MYWLLREKVERPLPGQKEIAAAAHRDEIFHPFEAKRPFGRRDRERARGAAVADDCVDLVLQRLKTTTEYPDLLQELELALDIGIEAHEHQAGLGQGVLRPVGTADAENAVTVGDRKLLRQIRDQIVARICPADMGAERTSHPRGILGAEQKIVVGLHRPAGF